MLTTKWWKSKNFLLVWVSSSMSKAKSIELDLNELHDINNELFEALHDSEYAEAKKLCVKGIRAYRDIIVSVRKNISLN